MPDHQCYLSYIKMEMRYGELDHCRVIWDRYTTAHNVPRAWIRYARWEEKQGEIQASRQVFERAMEALEEDANDEIFFQAFAKFELDHISKSEAQELYKNFVSFEKQHGDKAGIE